LFPTPYSILYYSSTTARRSSCATVAVVRNARQKHDFSLYMYLPFSSKPACCHSYGATVCTNHRACRPTHIADSVFRVLLCREIRAWMSVCMLFSCWVLGVRWLARMSLQKVHLGQVHFLVWVSGLAVSHPRSRRQVWHLCCLALGAIDSLVWVDG
jgi:hypothetical protein